jgi:hypothetical protein
MTDWKTRAMRTRWTGKTEWKILGYSVREDTVTVEEAEAKLAAADAQITAYMNQCGEIHRSDAARIAALEAARDKALDTAEEFRVERDEAKAELRRLRAAREKIDEYYERHPAELLKALGELREAMQ